MIDTLVESIRSIDWPSYLMPSLQLVVAFALAIPIGWERERSTRIMGLRTFPIVAVASCGYVLIGTQVVGADAGAQARLIQGLMSGIGFIGGGAILKEGATVRGTATAATVWTTGAVGASVAFDRYEIAVGIVILNFLVLGLFTPLKEVIDDDGEEREK